MDKKFISTNRGKVYYWINRNDSNRCIMFTHGVTADHTTFDQQLDFWSKDYTVITWDMPLHGESRPYREFSFTHVAEDMKQILDTEHITHAVIVGQSAGGYATQAFIQKYPKMSDAFISIDSTPFGRRYYKNSELFWTNHYSDIARFYPYGYYCNAATKAVARTEESRNNLYNCLVKLGKKGMLEAAAAVYHDFPKYEEVIFSCPVLLLLGEYDKLGYVKRYNEMWTKATGYPLVIIPEASHNSNFDNYEFFNHTVYEFLNQLSGKETA